MKTRLLATLVGLAFTSHVCAVDFDQNVTPTVIYGTGNSNGGFTVDRVGGLELGLRAHVRYPVPSDNAAGIMSQGNGSYGNFASGGFFSNGTSGGPRGSFNFDFSINSNYNGMGANLAASGLTFVLRVDNDPSAGTNFASGDPLLIPLNSFGDNTTPNGGGVEDGSRNPSNANLVQNSQNFAFLFPPALYNPNVSGIYDVQLLAFNGNTQVGGVGIHILVGDAVLPVPEPASLLAWGAVSLMGAAFGIRRRLAS